MNNIIVQQIWQQNKNIFRYGEISHFFSQLEYSKPNLEIISYLDRQQPKIPGKKNDFTSNASFSLKVFDTKDRITKQINVFFTEHCTNQEIFEDLQSINTEIKPLFSNYLFVKVYDLYYLNTSDEISLYFIIEQDLVEMALPLYKTTNKVEKNKVDLIEKMIFHEVRLLKNTKCSFKRQNLEKWLYLKKQDNNTYRIKCNILDTELFHFNEEKYDEEEEEFQDYSSSLFKLFEENQIEIDYTFQTSSQYFMYQLKQGYYSQLIQLHELNLYEEIYNTKGLNKISLIDYDEQNLKFLAEIGDKYWYVIVQKFETFETPQLLQQQYINLQQRLNQQLIPIKNLRIVNINASYYFIREELFVESEQTLEHYCYISNDKPNIVSFIKYKQRKFKSSNDLNVKRLKIFLSLIKSIQIIKDIGFNQFIINEDQIYIDLSQEEYKTINIILSPNLENNNIQNYQEQIRNLKNIMLSLLRNHPAFECNQDISQLKDLLNSLINFSSKDEQNLISQNQNILIEQTINRLENLLNVLTINIELIEKFLFSKNWQIIYNLQPKQQQISENDQSKSQEQDNTFILTSVEINELIINKDTILEGDEEIFPVLQEKQSLISLKIISGAKKMIDADFKTFIDKIDESQILQIPYVSKLLCYIPQIKRLELDLIFDEWMYIDFNQIKQLQELQYFTVQINLFHQENFNFLTQDEIEKKDLNIKFLKQHQSLLKLFKSKNNFIEINFNIVELIAFMPIKILNKILIFNEQIFEQNKMKTEQKNEQNIQIDDNSLICSNNNIDDQTCKKFNFNNQSEKQQQTNIFQQQQSKNQSLSSIFQSQLQTFINPFQQQSTTNSDRNYIPDNPFQQQLITKPDNTKLLTINQKNDLTPESLINQQQSTNTSSKLKTEPDVQQTDNNLQKSDSIEFLFKQPENNKSIQLQVNLNQQPANNLFNKPNINLFQMPSINIFENVDNRIQIQQTDLNEQKQNPNNNETSESILKYKNLTASSNYFFKKSSDQKLLKNFFAKTDKYYYYQMVDILHAIKKEQNIICNLREINGEADKLQLELENRDVQYIGKLNVIINEETEIESYSCRSEDKLKCNYFNMMKVKFSQSFISSWIQSEFKTNYMKQLLGPSYIPSCSHSDYNKIQFSIFLNQFQVQEITASLMLCNYTLSNGNIHFGIKQNQLQTLGKMNLSYKTSLDLQYNQNVLYYEFNKLKKLHTISIKQNKLTQKQLQLIKRKIKRIVIIEN